MEITPTPSPEVNPVATAVSPTTPRSLWFLIIFGISLFSFVAGVLLVTYLNYSKVEPVLVVPEVAIATSSPATTTAWVAPLSSANIVASPVIHITFPLAPGWLDVTDDQTEVDTPDTISDYRLVLEHATSGCVAAWGNNDREELKEYKQISFAERLFDRYNQHDGSWYAPDPQGQFVFSYDERQRIGGEVLRYYSSSYPGSVVLWVGRDSDVPDHCVMDLKMMLTSLDYYYPPYPSTIDLRGVLRVARPHNAEKGTVPRQLLTITDPETQSTYSYMALPTSTGWYAHSYIEDSLLYTNTRGDNGDEILVVDVLGSSTMRFPITWYDEGTTITSLYPRGGKVYVAVVPTSQNYCLDKGSCTADIVMLDLSTREVTLVAGGIRATGIVGYDADGAVLYVTGGWGDAGCASSRIFAIKDGVAETLLDASYCVGDDTGDYEAAKAVEEYVVAKLQNDQTPAASAVFIEKGVISSNPFLELNDGSSFTVVK